MLIGDIQTLQLWADLEKNHCFILYLWIWIQAKRIRKWLGLGCHLASIL